MDTSTYEFKLFSKWRPRCCSTIYGSPINDIIRWLIQVKAITIDVGAGDDIVHIKDDDAADQRTKMGTGDDFLIINASRQYDTLLDGGGRTNTLVFDNSQLVGWDNETYGET